MEFEKESKYLIDTEKKWETQKINKKNLLIERIEANQLYGEVDKIEKISELSWGNDKTLTDKNLS